MTPPRNLTINKLPVQLEDVADNITELLACLNEFSEFRGEELNSVMVAFKINLKVCLTAHSNLLYWSGFAVLRRAFAGAQRSMASWTLKKYLTFRLRSIARCCATAIYARYYWRDWKALWWHRFFSGWFHQNWSVPPSIFSRKCLNALQGYQLFSPIRSMQQKILSICPR